MPFESWNVGDELFNSLDKEHDLLDRDLRPFAEESDHMQGIQVIASVDDAWGGFAARYMDRIRDEYGKTAVYVWGLEDSIKSIPRVNHALKGCYTLISNMFSGETVHEAIEYSTVSLGDCFTSVAIHSDHNAFINPT